MQLLNSDESSKKVRLNRYMAQCGFQSRRKADDLIRGGHVFVNGKRVTEMGVTVSAGVDTVEIHGKVVKPVHQREYFALNKPREVMVTKDDPEGRVTVYDVLTKAGVNADHLKYVGRLDYQSEGLLLFTNDGDLIHAVTHPRYSIKKVYRVKVSRKLTDDEIERFRNGVESEGQLLRAGDVQEVSEPLEDRKQFWYEIDLYEGKNRQVRRMMEAIDVQVGRLKRVRFGCVKLEDLPSGAVRKLTEKEISGLGAAGYPVKTKSKPHNSKD
jgi:23S rRNA pseudouridine2605 synthase